MEKADALDAGKVVENVGKVVIEEDKVAVFHKSKARFLNVFSGWLGWVFESWDLVVLALAIPLLMKAWNMTLAEAGLLSTATLGGMAVGAYSWGIVSDKWGRKKTLVFCLGAFGVLTMLCAFVSSWFQLMVLRVVTGFALGGEWAIGAALVSESFPTNQRAMANSIVGWGWPFGFFGALGVQWWLVPTYGWKVLFLSAVITVVGAIWIAIYAKESPVWLRQQEAKAKNAPAAVSAPAQEKIGWSVLFEAENVKATVLCALVMISHSIAYWGLYSWLPAFLNNELKMTIHKTVLYLVVLNGGGMLGYVACAYIADRFGRKWSVYFGGFGSGAAVLLWMTASTPAVAYTMAAFTGFFTFGYWGPLGAFMAEQFRTKVRGTWLSFAYGTGRIFAAISPFILGTFAQAYSLRTALMVLSVFFTFISIATFFMKETKGEGLKD